MQLSPPPPPRWLRLLSVLRRWFCCCWLFCLLLLPLWESVIVLCFVFRYFMSILVLQSSWWGRESWLLCLICLPGVSWWLSGSSSRCQGVVCGLWSWYFLIILTYYFQMYFRRLLCVKIEIDQLYCVNCWVIIHCFSVSWTKINHSCCALMSWSSLQLTSKQWIITQQFTARADLFFLL